MDELKKRVIHVEGTTVGYQFNKLSMGYRTFKRTVVVDKQGHATVYIPLLGRSIRVRQVWEASNWHWEAF